MANFHENQPEQPPIHLNFSILYWVCVLAIEIGRRMSGWDWECELDKYVRGGQRFAIFLNRQNMSEKNLNDLITTIYSNFL